MTGAILRLLALVIFVACNEPSFSDVQPILFTTESVAEGSYLKSLGFAWSVNGITGADDYQLLEIDYYILELDPDGASGYSQVDINGDGKINALDRVPLPGQSTDASTESFIALHLVDFLTGRYQVVARQADNSELARSDAIYLLNIASETLIGYFKASNTDALDLFGRSVSLSQDGNTLAIGAPGEASSATGIGGDEADNSSPDAGAVYVFRRDAAGLWSQEAYIKASNTDAGDGFGGAVSLDNDGNRLVVGAAGEASGGNQGDNSSPDAGAVYAFARSNSDVWSQESYIKASNTNAGDRFGHAVRVSGNGSALAVGAVGEASSATGIGGDEADNSSPDAGAVYVYRRSGIGNWSQQEYIKASNTGAGDEFGSAVSLVTSGNTLAVGARFEDSDATGVDGDQNNDLMPDSGAVYLFGFSQQQWMQDAYVKASNTGAGDEFGGAVSFTPVGRDLAVGAPEEASNATGVDGDQSNDDMAGAGAVYTFTFDSDESPPWLQVAYIKASNTGADDGFGTAVSLSESADVLAVGAPGEDSSATGLGGDGSDNSAAESGAAYSFALTPEGIWAQRNYIKASNTDPGDEFGGDVSLSGLADMLIVGAEFEESNATGIGGGDQSDDSAADAGAAYLY